MSEALFSVRKGYELVGDDFNTDMINGGADPSVAPGVAANISSSYVRAVMNPDDTTYTITVYDKFGPQDTDWQMRDAQNVLGTPTDGTYLDGLFTLTPMTKTGDAVDQINEFLSLMAPPPAPILSDLESALIGVTGKLSFDTTHAITGYSYDATSINSQVSKTGNDLGIFNGSTAITGILNNNQAASSVSAWPAKAFGPGDQGNLELWVNDTKVHTVDLTTYAGGTTLAAGSGFTLSAATPVQFSNGNQFPALTYRTGTINIAAAAQRPGYNFAQVKQVTGSTVTTNTYYWYNSVDATAMTASGSTLSPTMTNTRYLSGVDYYTGGSLRLQSLVHMAYADVYSASASAVSPSSAAATLAAAALPATTSNVLDLTVDISGNLLGTVRLLGAAASASFSVAHPLKSTLNVSGINSGLILYDPVVTSQALTENFNIETYRCRSTLVPATATATPPAYDATLNVSTAGELQFYNGLLRYPSGDFRSVSDGGTIDFAPAGNPNYAGATGLKTFVRAFQNTSGQTRANFKLNIAGASTTFAAAGGASGNAITVEMKFPQGSLSAGTGWMDAYADFATGVWTDGAGCRAGALGNGRALSTDWGISVGTQSIAANEWIYIRVTAAAAWAGNLDNIVLTWL